MRDLVLSGIVPSQRRFRTADPELSHTTSPSSGDNMNLPAQPLYSVFISYAHGDDDERDASKKWAERLRLHIAPMTRKGLVLTWSDKDIPTGANWHEVIQTNLQNAKAAVLLVGPNFLASEYIRRYELPVLLEKARTEQLPIICIIARPCLLHRADFLYPNPEHGPQQTTLAVFQSVNPPDRPLNSLAEDEQDLVLSTAAERLFEIAAPSTTGTNDNSPPPDMAVRAVTDALSVLSNLIRNTPEVRAAARRFQDDFKATSAQSEVLSKYKDLHDYLHTLQLRCGDPISTEIECFPDDVRSATRLIGHEDTLQSAIDSIRDQEARWQGSFDVQSLLSELEAALEKLQRARTTVDKVSLQRAAADLGAALNRYPGQLNSNLIKAAKSLRLPSLLTAMEDIQVRVAELRLRAEAVNQFANGVDALRRLNDRLHELLFEHNQWQIADEELRVIQINADDFLDDLWRSWPRLKVITTILYYNNPQNWAGRFKLKSELLDDALQKGKPASAISSAFELFRRAARMRFYAVDLELKALCSELRNVGAPLDSVFRLLEST